MKCRICEHKSIFAFKTTILGKYSASFYKCNYCGFLQSENPYWLEESYTEAINLSDTGILARNEYLRKIVTVLTFCIFGKDTKILDWGGGYGIMVRMLRDDGWDAYWYDEYAQNIFAKPFTKDKHKKYNLITSFELFEHLPNPLNDIEKMLNISDNILFSTLLIPQEIPSLDWWYYGFKHGQHISFYSKQTLKFIANKYNLNYVGTNSIHLFSKKKINLLSTYFLLRLSNYGLYPLIKKWLNSKMQADSLQSIQDVINNKNSDL